MARRCVACGEKIGWNDAIAARRTGIYHHSCAVTRTHDPRALIAELDALDDVPKAWHAGEGIGDTHIFPFALIKIVSDRENWTKSIGSLAVSAITAPLIGLAVFATPGRERRGMRFPLELMLCTACVKTRTRLFGGVRVNRRDYGYHPWVAVLETYGFTELVLPDGDNWKHA